MTVVRSMEHERVARIAEHCKGIDPTWHRSLMLSDPIIFQGLTLNPLDPDKQKEAIDTCESRLNKLATETLRCGAFSLQVRYHKENDRGRESVKIGPLYFVSNEKLTPQTDSNSLPLVPSKNSDFYLLYDGRIIHVILDASLNNGFDLGCEENDLSDISISQINNLRETNLNHCFVTLRDIIHIPQPQGNEEKKQ